jgi:hypothetical protein
MEPLSVSSIVAYIKAEDGKECPRIPWFLGNKRYRLSWTKLMKLIPDERELLKVRKQLTKLEFHNIKHYKAEELLIKHSKSLNKEALEKVRKEFNKHYGELIKLGNNDGYIRKIVNEFEEKTKKYICNLNIDNIKDAEYNLECELFGVKIAGRIDVIEEREEKSVGWEVKIGKSSEYHRYQAFLYKLMLSAEEFHIVYLPNGPHVKIYEDCIIHDYGPCILEHYDSSKIEERIRKAIIGNNNLTKKKKNKVPMKKDFCPRCLYRWECR